MKTKVQAKNKKQKPPKGKVGRPTKLTPEVIEKFTAAISIGSSYTLASRYAGVSEVVTALWMRDARRELTRREAEEIEDEKAEPFIRFLMAVREAEAEAAIPWQEVLNKAAKVDPVWADKMLRKRFPDYVEPDVSEEIEIPSDMPVEYLDRIIAGEPAMNVVREWKNEQLQSISASNQATKAEG